MRTTYRVLAYLVALEVAVQAAAIAFAVFGLGKWIEDGGTLDKATMESEDSAVTGAVGFMVHGINGQLLIPLLAILLLLVSFFAKVPGGVKWAGFVLLAVVVQVLLGMFAHGAPSLGMLHGLNALVLFGVALRAGMLARSGRTEEVAVTATTSQEPEVV
ncbi:MAG TPA: hypothetical protein VF049_17085 [Nocardioidaceae bacterium]|jgi:hypothetical protein